ncbi:hypothetical protein D0T84_22610 [Dysgonomonas sp. 521]|uniref:hypothetical protein n=1 Tax=Dysgonomonas sp. 521 TaxID=2302932 RepID=UPI0013CFB472|nr:hypothetical protein [Dysgonomonas sp. 521]NDV97651.1 hypothetical protein [Dysgonomonas sp. 521]
MTKIERMKLGRRAAYLRKCILVQQLLAEHENETTVRRRVFSEYIKPVIRCSYQQFNNMLNEHNPSKEHEEIEAKLKKMNI